MNSLIKTFVRNPVAPNLAMFVMIIMGLWATSSITRQLLPDFSLNFISVTVQWPGAAAQDVEGLITQTLEDAVLGLDKVNNVSSISRDNLSTVTLEYAQDTDMGAALNDVKNAIASIRNLPSQAEQPQIVIPPRNERVSRIVITAPQLQQLRPIVERLERELRASGFSGVEVNGLPKEEIAIELPAQRLTELNLSLNEIADRVRGTSSNVPAGTLGEKETSVQLRSLDQRRSVSGFTQLPIDADSTGRLLTLGDIAQISRRPMRDSPMIFADNRPAVEIVVKRGEVEDAIDVANKLSAWAKETRVQLPQNVELRFYDELWRVVDYRIELMFSNAVYGLILLVIILYVFLNGRVALWVAAGIPVSILVSMVALYALGGSINVMSLFAMIMTLGIIVDDAIVVSEEAVTLSQRGAAPARAAEKAALRMFGPVTAASLTTVAAFLPLMAIGGTVGSILFAIPLVVVCVVLASLLECFIILPGHLHHALKADAKQQPNKLRRTVDLAFNRFREGKYKTAARYCVDNRRTTLAVSIAGIFLVVGLLAGGRVGFSFFPQPDGSTITATVRFAAGTPGEKLSEFLTQVEQALLEAEAATGEDIVSLYVSKRYATKQGETGSHLGEIVVELLPGDFRETTNAQLAREWERRVVAVPGLDQFLIETTSGGVPGADIDVQISGASPSVLKAAAMQLQENLRQYAGVSVIKDDLNYGKEQLILALTPVGRALGLTAQSLGEQVRASFAGELVQSFQDKGREVEVRVSLLQSERESLRALESLPIILPNGDIASLTNLASIRFNRGFDDLKHEKGLLAVRVSADVDSQLNNSNALRNQLANEVLPAIAQKYAINWAFRGKAQDQSQSVGGIKLALPISLLMIYVILAAVFRSYIWPIAVLSIIPFSVVGAIAGHWLLGVDMTMLSMFGIFGLCGIVINDSIILIVVYQALRKEGMPFADAAVEAGCRRLRAVLLTSLTTIVGITPLLFESSEEAAFLKPMVISISFGLMFGTLIVIFLLPAMLAGIESLIARLSRLRSDRVDPPDLHTPAGVLVAAVPHALTTNDPLTVQTLSELSKTPRSLINDET